MSMNNNNYHSLLKLLHWLMAVIIIGLLAVGIYMEDLPKSDFKWELYSWHKSFGVLVIGLIAIRIITRLTTSIPAMPSGLKSWEVSLAHIIHILLYVGMIAIPLSGYIMSDAGDYGVKFFGITLPDFIVKNKDIGGIAHEIHELAPYFIGIIALHVLGALKHRFFDKAENNVLPRMLPNCSKYCKKNKGGDDAA